MNLLNYLLTILILVVTGCGRKNVEKKDGNTRPNIIFILADDLGYMDIQEYAQHTLHTDKSDMFYETPNLDRLSRSEEHTSELQSLMRISYAVFCLKKKTEKNNNN